MKIEDGKYYITRKGNYYGGPVASGGTQTYPYYVDHFYDIKTKVLQSLYTSTYTEDGEVFHSGKHNDFDLMQECDKDGNPIMTTKPKFEIGKYYRSIDGQAYYGPMQNYGIDRLSGKHNTTGMNVVFDSDGTFSGHPRGSNRSLGIEVDKDNNIISTSSTKMDDYKVVCDQRNSEYGKPIHEMKLEDYKRNMKMMEDAGQKLY